MTAGWRPPTPAPPPPFPPSGGKGPPCAPRGPRGHTRPPPPPPRPAPEPPPPPPRLDARHRLLREVAQPALVRVGPQFLGKAYAAKRVVPVGRVRAAVRVAVEGDAKLREHAHVAAVARLRRVGERPVPVEEHRAQRT